MEQASMEDLAQACLQVVHASRSCSVNMALKAATKLEVMDILAEHTGRMLSASQIIQHFRSPIAPSTSPQAAAASLDRILRVLASHGLLLFSAEPSGAGAGGTGTGGSSCDGAASANGTGSETAAGSAGAGTTAYGITLASSLLLRSKEASLEPMLHLFGCKHELEDLQYTVVEGTTPFTRCFGQPLFPFMEQHAGARESFQRAMAACSAVLVPALLRGYSGFAHITGTLVDVGGAKGDFLRLIVSAHPHIKGINFDRDCVIAKAPDIPGLEHLGGDMFKSVPHGDAIVMKLILHDWSDEECLKILKNCYEALPSKGKVIVIDRVLPSKVECSLRAQALYQADLFMMAQTGNGKERTFEEFEHLAKASGFKSALMTCDTGLLVVLELCKG